jgi:hypothetical protein
MPSPCFAYSSNMKTKAVCISETSVNVYRTTRLYIPEDESTFQVELYAWHHSSCPLPIAPVPECELLMLSYSVKQAGGRATARAFRDRTAQKCVSTPVRRSEDAKGHQNSITL